MAKAATKSQIIAKIAEDADLSKVQAKTALESLVAQAYAGAKDGFRDRHHQADQPGAA